MVHSRLPLPSLRSLFGALLMLSPELLLGTLENRSNAPLCAPGLRKALAFAVEQYNQDREDSANYFKQLRVLKVQCQVGKKNKYHFKVELVKTKCEKEANKTKIYKTIQKCEQLQGNQEGMLSLRILSVSSSQKPLVGKLSSHQPLLLLRPIQNETVSFSPNSHLLRS